VEIVSVVLICIFFITFDLVRFLLCEIASFLNEQTEMSKAATNCSAEIEAW
jgi:hypothetical protein